MPRGFLRRRRLVSKTDRFVGGTRVAHVGGMSALPRSADIARQHRHVRFVPMSDIGECLNGEIFYSLKEGRAKILGFLPLAGYAGLRFPFGGTAGNVRSGWWGGLSLASPPAST